MNNAILYVAKLYAAIQLLPAILAENWWVVLAIIVLTLLWGRVYCRFICPLGILQSLVRGFRGPRRVCTRMHLGDKSKVRLVTIASILVAVILVGIAGLGFQWLDPYAIVTRAICFFTTFELDWVLVGFSVLPLVVILLLAAFVGGRLWCNWVCPVGTILSFLSRFAWKQDKFNKCAGCEKCRRCIK